MFGSEDRRPSRERNDGRGDARRFASGAGAMRAARAGTTGGGVLGAEEGRL